MAGHQYERRHARHYTPPSRYEKNSCKVVGIISIVDRCATRPHRHPPSISRHGQSDQGSSRWTQLQTLLHQAGIPPLVLLLDQATRRYRIQVLLRPDLHPCKARLIALLATPQRTHQPGTGRRGVGDLVKDIYSRRNKLQDTSNHKLPGVTDLKISTDTKEATAHNTRPGPETLELPPSSYIRMGRK